MSIFSTIIKSFLHVLSYWKVNYFSKQPCNITKENQIRQAWNFLTEAKTYPDEVQGKLWCSLPSSLLAGTEATPLLSAWTQPRYPGARALRALRRQSSRQLVTEPSLKAKRPAPAGQRWGWRPLRAAREERAAPRSQTSEGSPRSSSAVSAQTGSPNWNGAKNLHDTAQHTAREQLIKNHTEWKEHKHKLCNWRHISIKNYQHFRKQLKIYMALSLVMSSETQQKSQYTKCFKLN